MGLRRALFVTMVMTPVLALVACRGQTLDVGSTAPPSLPPADADGQDPTDLVVDGIACPKVLVFGTADPWPAWKVSIHAKCGSMDVAGDVSGQADAPYPQPCTPSTASFVINTTDVPDAGITFIGVGGEITSGAALAEPGAPLAFEATVAHGGDTSQGTHRIVYRAHARITVAPSPTESGVDANIGEEPER